MSSEITHRHDPDDGHIVQIVSPARLREILDKDGEDYSRPRDFGPDDEWNVEEDRAMRKIKIPGTQITVDADDYVVIDDGGFRYPMDRDDLDGQTEESLRAMRGPDEYSLWCSEHRMDERAGSVGSQGCLDFCAALIEAGAEEWSVG